MSVKHIIAIRHRIICLLGNYILSTKNYYQTLCDTKLNKHSRTIIIMGHTNFLVKMELMSVQDHGSSP